MSMDTNCYKEEIKGLSVGLEDGVYGFQPGKLLKAEEVIASNMEIEAIVIVFQGMPYLYKMDGCIDKLGDTKNVASSISVVAFLLRNQNSIYSLTHKLKNVEGSDNASGWYSQNWTPFQPFAWIHRTTDLRGLDDGQ